MLAPGAVGDHLRRIGGFGGDIDATSPRQSGKAVAVPLQFRAGPTDEFIDIAMIVGEQDVALHMFGGRAGIMFQTRQRKVGAQTIEQRQRPIAVRIRHEQAIGNLVANLGQFGRGEIARQFGRGRAVERPHVQPVQNIGKGDLLVTEAGFDLHPIVADEQVDLFGQIIGEHRGTGNGGDIAARFGQAGEGPARRRCVAVTMIGDAQFGIAETLVVPGLRRRDAAVATVSAHGVAQCFDGCLIEAVKLRDRCAADALCHRPLLTQLHDGRKSARDRKCTPTSGIKAGPAYGRPMTV